MTREIEVLYEAVQNRIEMIRWLTYFRTLKATCIGRVTYFFCRFICRRMSVSIIAGAWLMLAPIIAIQACHN